MKNVTGVHSSYQLLGCRVLLSFNMVKLLDYQSSWGQRPRLEEVGACDNLEGESQAQLISLSQEEYSPDYAMMEWIGTSECSTSSEHCGQSISEGRRSEADENPL